eukprot:2202022-Amphidinium_carterae.1
MVNTTKTYNGSQHMFSLCKFKSSELLMPRRVLQERRPHGMTSHEFLTTNRLGLEFGTMFDGSLLIRNSGSSFLSKLGLGGFQVPRRIANHVGTQLHQSSAYGHL